MLDYGWLYCYALHNHRMQAQKVVIIMWINVVIGVEIIALFVVPFGMFIMGLLKVASMTDDQSEQWLVENRKDNGHV